MVLSQEQIDFYNENGYLIIRDVITPLEVKSACKELDIIYEQFAKECQINLTDYKREISQIRDLWIHNSFYKNLLSQSALAPIASQLMGTTAARLLHDHLIAKPLQQSDTVPWHQDYPYWPVDTSNGLSVWLSLDDLDEFSGVLEVIPKSHLLGEKAPIDFIQNPEQGLDQSINKISLPIKKGDAVLLHSLTWHKTAPNTSTPMRRAYITLWIPPNAKYAPLHADWHPVNYHVTVDEGEILNDDYFIVIGDYKKEQSNVISPTQFLFHGPDIKEEDFTMFNASKKVKLFLMNKLSNEVDKNINLWNYLYDKENRKKVTSLLCQEYQIPTKVQEVEECLYKLAINAIAYQKHKARNVYNHAYVQFQHLFLNT